MEPSDLVVNTTNEGPCANEDPCSVTNVDPEQNPVEAEVKLTWEREQLALKEQLVCEDTCDWARCRVTPCNVDQHSDVVPLRYIGGVDISFVKDDPVNACSGLVVIELPTLEVVYEDYSLIQLTEPYISGFLAFREVSFIVDKVNKLKEKSPELMPQVILCDGNGTIHPLEFGLACHLGVLLDIPTIGAAKKLFQVFGLEKNEEHKQKIEQLTETNNSFPLISDSGKTLGMALIGNARAKNPIYVSPGHKMTLDTAVWVVKQCCNFRVPEPVRQPRGKEAYRSPAISIISSQQEDVCEQLRQFFYINYKTNKADIRSRKFLLEHFIPEVTSTAECSAVASCHGGGDNDDDNEDDESANSDDNGALTV